MIHLINLRGKSAAELAKQGVGFAYIGRGMFIRGVRLHASPLANPFRMGQHGDAAECCELYRRSLHAKPAGEIAVLMEKLFQETGAGSIPLACWCGEWRPGEPEILCHGVAVIKELIRHYPELGAT